MSPIVASILTWSLIGFLYWRERRAKPKVTAALWIPFVWFFLIGTRTFSQWMEIGGYYLAKFTKREVHWMGAIFFIIIFAGLMVLRRRHFSLAIFRENNRWLYAFLIYGLISVLWSDFTFVALKRWIKVMGHPIMVLVLFSEPDPEEAVIQLMKRCAFVILPVSVLFIKYYPQYGRMFDPYAGLPSNVGAALDKNMLGAVCMVLSVFLFWYQLKIWQRPKSKQRFWDLVWNAVVLGFGFWTMNFAQSSTALVSMVVAMSIIVVLGLKFVDKRNLFAYLIVLAVVGFISEYVFDIYAQILHLLGKNTTLTDRTNVWGEVLKIDINPIIGTGFESFWLGERRETLWQIYWWHPIQAHNGYLETYLNLGLVGLGFMVMLIVHTYQKATRMLLAGVDYARFRLGFVAAFALYNCTEAAFKALHPVWFVFFIALIDYPRFTPDSEENQTAEAETEVSVPPEPSTA